MGSTINCLVKGGLVTEVALIGSGTFGNVYSATDSRSGNTVAIKEFRYLSDLAQVELEVEIYKQLDGVEGFPRVYDRSELTEVPIQTQRSLTSRKRDALQTSFNPVPGSPASIGKTTLSWTCSARTCGRCSITDAEAGSASRRSA
jgi:serine/threonine protein kinase